MALFAPKDPAEDEAARARQLAMTQAAEAKQHAVYEWAYGAPPGDLAAELMAAFGAGDTENGLAEGTFRTWLGCWERRYGALDGPIREGLQLLEHSELCASSGFSAISGTGAPRDWAWRPSLAAKALSDSALRIAPASSAPTRYGLGAVGSAVGAFGAAFPCRQS